MQCRQLTDFIFSAQGLARFQKPIITGDRSRADGAPQDRKRILGDLLSAIENLPGDIVVVGDLPEGMDSFGVVGWFT